MNQILLIEDNQTNSFAITQLLIKAGYNPKHILLCTSMREVESQKNVHPDIVLADLSLPDSPFDKTFDQVQEIFPSAPIIVLTGKDEIPLAIKTIQQGAQNYLVKGRFDEELLTRSIQYAIERKKIFNELRNSRNKYLRLFDENPGAMYMYDTSTFEILAVNKAACLMYGYTERDFLKLSALSIRPEDDIPLFLALPEERSGNYYNAGAWRHIKKNGDVFYVQVFSHSTEYEGRFARLVSVTDIDQTVRAEAELQNRINQIEHILASMSDGFFRVDSNWNFTYVNKAFEEISGRSEGDMLGQNLWELTAGNVKETIFYKEYERAVNEQVNVHFEAYAPGMKKWLSINAYPIEGGLAVYHADITEPKEYTQKIEKQNKQLQEIAWLHSHKIRGPVATILGLAQLLDEEANSHDTNLEIVAKIKEATDNLDNVIRKIVANTGEADSE